MKPAPFKNLQTWSMDVTISDRLSLNFSIMGTISGAAHGGKCVRDSKTVIYNIR
jgi:hypothetical protein